MAVIDDAQWIDTDTLDVLAFAAYRLDGEPVTMIWRRAATCRRPDSRAVSRNCGSAR